MPVGFRRHFLYMGSVFRWDVEMNDQKWRRLWITSADCMDEITSPISAEKPDPKYFKNALEFVEANALEEAIKQRDAGFAIARAMSAEYYNLKDKFDKLKSEREAVGSGKLECADCGHILARW